MNTLLLKNYNPFILLALPNYDSQPNVYEQVISPICNELKLGFEIALDGVYKNSFSYRLNKQIEKADVIIADFSGLDSNVLSIAGHSKGLGKEVIFLIKSTMTFPYVKDFPSIKEIISFIEYEENIENCKNLILLALKKLSVTKFNNRI